MTDEKWQLLVTQAQKNFDEVSYYQEDLTGEINGELVKQGTADVLEFTNASGTFKVVRENKPVVLDRKMHYSHRQGTAAQTEYVFSDTEFSHKVKIYKQNDLGDWEKLESDNLNILV